MSNQLVITSGAKVRSLNGVITGTTGVLDSLPINAANGIPQLDSSGKILVSQLPNSVMEYKGTWNAATNTPTLADGTGNQGDVYLCNVAGTVNFGSGPISFVVGDQVIYSGTIWQRASGATGTVTSVAVTESGDALSITGSPITTSGTINIGFAGTSAQYVAGDGSLITFPTVVTQAQNLVTEVYNETGATLTKGTVVYINGGHGNLPTVTKAIATADSTSAQTYGVVRTDITNNNNGYVTVIGNLDNLDTQAYAAGTQLYLSSTTAGAWTSVKQYAPAHLVYVGIVVRSHPTQGVVEIRIQNGFELDELHNVSAQTPSNNDGIFYNSSNSLWEAKSIASALGYTPISLSSLSATSPLSYNSGTGVFSISQASGSTNGYLSSTDWNTFNNKQNALTNPVTGTGTSGQVSYFNGTSTITGSNNFKFDGTNLSIGNPSSALAQLHIYNSAAAASFLLQTNSTTDYSEIAVRNDSSTATSYFRQYSTAATGSDFGISRANLALFFSNYASNFAIGTRNGGSLIFGTADTERARIDTSGNFGIGTTSPSYKLDVSGTGRFSGDLAVTASSGARVLSVQSGGVEGRITATTSNWYIGSQSSVPTVILSGGATALTLATTGAATFSSSVGIGATAGTNGLFEVSNLGAGVTVGDFLVDAANKNVYVGRLSSTSNDNTNFIVRNRIGTAALYVTGNSGNVGIGTSSPSARLETLSAYNASIWVKATNNEVPISAFNSSNSRATMGFQGSTTSNEYTVRVGADGNDFIAYTSNTERLRITSGGALISPFTYSNTTANAANLYMGSTGTFERSTSSLKYKTDVKNYDKGLAEVLKMRSVYYKGIGQNDSDKQFAGLIAEEIHELGLTEFVQYAEDGSPDALAYQNMIALHTKAIQEMVFKYDAKFQEQQKQIEELKAKIK